MYQRKDRPITTLTTLSGITFDFLQTVLICSLLKMFVILPVTIAIDKRQHPNFMDAKNIFTKKYWTS